MYTFIHLYVSIDLSIYLFIYPSVYLFIYPSVYIYIYNTKVNNKRNYFLRNSEFHVACAIIFTRMKYNDLFGRRLLRKQNETPSFEVSSFLYC